MEHYNIGVQYLDAYPEKRNIINQVDQANYVFLADYYRKIIDFKLWLRRYSKLKRIFGNLIYQTSRERYSFFLRVKHDNIDFFHFFNSISIKAKQSWGVTFETSLPAFEPFSQFHKGHYENGNLNALKGIEKYLMALLDDKCKFIIAISQCTFNIQLSILDYFPEYKNATLWEIKKITWDTSLDLSSIDSSSWTDILKAKNILWATIKNVYLSDKRWSKIWLLPGWAWGGISYLPLESFFMKLKTTWYNWFITLKVNPNELWVSNEEMVLQNLEYSKNYYKKHFLNFK